MGLENKIKKWGFDLGFDLISISALDKSDYGDRVKEWLLEERQGEMNWYEKNLDRRLDPRKNLYNKARTSISVGLFYRPAELPLEILNDPSRGIIARYALYEDYHKVMEKMLKNLAEKISDDVNKWNYHIYVDTGPILEREIAARAGLGFIGKNTTLINTTLGSYMFLGEIICDLDLVSDQKSILNPKYLLENTSGTCASCSRCQQACPTGALLEPYVLDARKCVSYLTIENKGPIPKNLRSLLGNRIYGCDVCQEVCPWNKKVKSDLITKLKPKVDQAPYLLDLLDMTEADFREKYKGLPILRAKYRGFMRNVLVAVGNWADESAFLPVVKLLHSPEALIRQHAAWALVNINESKAQDFLEKLKKVESDPLVLQELESLGFN